MSALRDIDGGICSQCEVIAVAVTLLVRHCKGYGVQRLLRAGVFPIRIIPYPPALLHTLRLRQRTLLRLHFSDPKPNAACHQIVSQFFFNDVLCIPGQPTIFIIQPARLELPCDDLELFVQRLVLLIVSKLSPPVPEILFYLLGFGAAVRSAGEQGQRHHASKGKGKESFCSFHRRYLQSWGVSR